jgi:hypothetical protein
MDVATVPLPTVGHQVLLTRALESRKPFDERGGDGYRDALIWHTVLDICRECDGDTQVVFVTNNTNYFCDKDAGELLAPLQAEVAEFSTVTLTTAKSLTEAEVRLKALLPEPRAESVGVESPQAVEPKRQLIVQAVTRGYEALVGAEIGSADIGARKTADAPAFSDFRTIIEDPTTLEDIEPDWTTLEWTSIGRDGEKRLCVEASIVAYITLEGMAFKADYYVENDVSVAVYDGDWNNHYMWIGTHHTGRLSFTICLTPDCGDVDSVEFDHAEEIITETPPTSDPGDMMVRMPD